MTSVTRFTHSFPPGLLPVQFGLVWANLLGVMSRMLSGTAWPHSIRSGFLKCFQCDGQEGSTGCDDGREGNGTCGKLSAR